jgi:deoxyadenosine/deoxycytidine kinase
MANYNINLNNQQELPTFQHFTFFFLKKSRFAHLKNVFALNENLFKREIFYDISPFFGMFAAHSFLAVKINLQELISMYDKVIVLYLRGNEKKIFHTK